MKIFLQKLLEHLIYTTVVVIIFGVALNIWTMWEEGVAFHPIGPKIEPFYSHEEISLNFRLTEIKAEEASEVFIVTGRITNISKTIWYSVNLDLNYYVEDIKMGTCFRGTELENLKPNKTYYFSIECSDLLSDRLPSKFTYKPHFESGSKPYEAELISNDE
jgi:hypothetical protein